MILEVKIEEVKKGAIVLEPGSGAQVIVKKVKADGEFVELVFGLPFCLALRRPRGSVVSVWRRRASRKGKASDGNEDD